MVISNFLIDIDHISGVLTVGCLPPVFASYIWLADFSEIVGKNKIQKMIVGLTCLLKIN